MIVLIYNDYTHQMERYDLKLDDNMPYTTSRGISVREFSINSDTNILWSQRSFLSNFSKLLQQVNHDFEISSGFSRIWEVFEGERLHNKRGNGINGGTNLDYQQDINFRKLVEKSNNFTFVNCKSNEYSFTHINSHQNYVSESVPFQAIQLNDIGVDVCILQDALWFLGFEIKQINGYFDNNLENEVKLFQIANGLSSNGIVDSDTWFMLMHYVREDDINFIIE